MAIENFAIGCMADSRPAMHLRPVGLEIECHIDLYISRTLSGCNLPESWKGSQRCGISPAHNIEGIDKISAQSELDSLGDSNGL
jgi:hypothetical protein